MPNVVYIHQQNHPQHERSAPHGLSRTNCAPLPRHLAAIIPLRNMHCTNEKPASLTKIEKYIERTYTNVRRKAACWDRAGQRRDVLDRSRMHTCIRTSCVCWCVLVPLVKWEYVTGGNGNRRGLNPAAADTNTDTTGPGVWCTARGVQCFFFCCIVVWFGEQERFQRLKTKRHS